MGKRAWVLGSDINNLYGRRPRAQLADQEGGGGCPERVDQLSLTPGSVRGASDTDGKGLLR